MGGDVTVFSVPGEGSVFTIKLPAVVVEAPAAPVPEAAEGVMFPRKSPAGVISISVARKLRLGD